MADGDTVIFGDGTYDLHGPIVIRHTGLMISSDDGDGVTIRSTDNKGLVFRNFGDVSGLAIRGLDMASADTTRLAPARNFGMIFIEDTAGHDGIRILDNTFRGDKQNGIRIGSSNQSAPFTNIEIRDNTFDGIPADRNSIHISNSDVTLFANTFHRSDYLHLDGVINLVDLYSIYPGKPDRAPVVTPPPPVDLEATGLQTAVTPELLGIATATDDTDPSPVITHDSPGSFAVGTHTVTWTATDGTGNSGTAVQTVTIRDTTPPVITLLGDPRVTVEQDGTYEEMYATCTDLVDGDLPITSNGAVDTDTPGEYVLKYSCTDTASNPASVTRTVTVAPPRPLPQPTGLEIANSYDMGNGWRMMSINWTEPGQPPASGYDVTVTGSDGTLLPLSQFDILALTAELGTVRYPSGDYVGAISYGEVRSYSMDGYRNPQGDFKFNSDAYIIDVYDNLVYGSQGGGVVSVHSLDGTYVREHGPVPPEFFRGFDVIDGEFLVVRKDISVNSYDMTTFNATERINDRAISEGEDVAKMGDMIYVLADNKYTGVDSYVFVYEMDGTYVPAKSFALPEPKKGHFTSMDADERTGTLWVRFDDETIVHAYLPPGQSNAQARLLFSLDLSVHDTELTADRILGYFSVYDIALTTPVVSDTVTVPAGTDSTAYYYYAPANETVTHTVQLAVPSSEPPAAVKTRGGTVMYPPVTVFNDTFDSGLGPWTYQERPYGSLNTMFCGTDDDGTAAYSLTLSNDAGGSAHVMNGDTCWFGLAGASRTFDVPAGHGGGNLTVSLDYRTRADFGNQTMGGHANNLFYAVTDSAGDDLDNGTLFLGKRHTTEDDSNWATATVTVQGLETSSCPCEIVVYTADMGWDAYNKRFSIDNVNATMTRP